MHLESKRLIHMVFSGLFELGISYNGSMLRLIILYLGKKNFYRVQRFQLYATFGGLLTLREEIARKSAACLWDK